MLDNTDSGSRFSCHLCRANVTGTNCGGLIGNTLPSCSLTWRLDLSNLEEAAGEVTEGGGIGFVWSELLTNRINSSHWQSDC